MAGSIHFVPQDDIAEYIDKVVDELTKAAPFAAKVSRSAVINIILRKGIEVTNPAEFMRGIIEPNKNVNCA